jgi:hypothetical protein
LSRKVVGPEAVVVLKVGEFGRLIVRMQGGGTLEVSRGAVPGLKERLGFAKGS